MLQNKWFIALLILLLIVVAAYNIQYFSNKDAGAMVNLERKKDVGMTLKEVMEIEEKEDDLPSHLPQSHLRAEPIKLASIETLKEALPSFSAKEMKRNPFLTEKEILAYRRKSLIPIRKTIRKISKLARKKVKQKGEPPISSLSIKMIYRWGGESYVWIRGRAWREGEMIGKSRILRINKDSILLERGGKQTALFIDRAPEVRSKGVQID